MTIIEDLIFMAVDAHFKDYEMEGETGVLVLPNEDETYELVKQLNFRFHDFRQFDNFKGGFCLTDDTRTLIHILMYLVDENEEICTITKNYRVVY